MGISEKLPLINSHNKLVKIIGYAVYGFLAFVVVVFVLAATSPDRPESIDKNVVLRGYTFTLANADGWVTDSTTERADG